MDEPSHYPLITSLPNEVLVHIFLFCDLQSIGRLSSTCRQFNSLIKNAGCLWLYKSQFVLGSNMMHPDMIKRCNPIWPFIERCQISRNWKRGFAQMTIALKYDRCLPWMMLEADFLYYSKGQVIERIKRSYNDGRLYFSTKKIFQPLDVDITKFTITETETVIGFTNGVLGRWRKNDMKTIDCFAAHSDEIFSVDAKKDIIVSGSRDKNIMIWKTALSAHTGRTVLQKKIPMDVRVLSTAIMPSNSYFIAGMSGTNSIHPLQQFDLERGNHITNFSEHFRHGAGILGIYPEDENTFLCCGYDSTIQLWDLRCPTACVKKWTDPFDNSVYCICSDHNVTIVSGANRNGTIFIWDKRNTRCEWMFQVKGLDSPVYSVAFDASQLFASLHKGIAQFSYV